MNNTSLKKQNLFIVTFFVLLFCFYPTQESVSVSSNVVEFIQLNDDTINPVTAEYIVNAIDQAEANNAECLVIKLDTPGGLLTSTRLIVKKIFSAKIPVVVYISPSGSRAGSAGVFITYASHVAAMAPSTNIGAAHPVQIGGKQKQRDVWDGFKELIKEAKKKSETDEKKEGGASQEESEDVGLEPDPDPMSSKILQDTVAFIKSIAEKRNRNVDWAIKSVTKSSSVTETEALELGVVEIIAASDEELLQKLDGRVIKLTDREVTLNTKNSTIRKVGMDFRQQFFNVLANPNIAYILMILGFYGLMYEVTHPGFGVPGVLGTIFLILAFFSMQTLPTNYAGLALLILGLVLFIAEAYTPGFGIFALGGVVCMILGSLLLFDSSSAPMMRVSWSLILSFTGTTAGITIFLVRAVIRAHSQKALSGKEGMIGQEGDVQIKISPGKEGKVFVHGELWNAVSNEEIAKEEKITVTEINRMTLIVKRKS